MGETYEEKSLIKMMKGPFYQYASLEGIQEDNFVNCAVQDLIDYASTPAPRVLLLGKPRSGKTTLAKLLAARLDLVHVSVENWLARLLDKIKNYEPPEEELEEGQAPPKWLSDLEDAVDKALKAGSGPSHEQTVAILKEDMSSAQARTRGFVLDLTFYKSPDSWAKIIRGQEGREGLLGPNDAAGRAAEFSHVIELDCDDEEVKLRARHLRLDPEDGQVYSRWERAERNKAGHLNKTIPVPVAMLWGKPAHFPGPKEGKCLNCGDTALWRQMEAHWAGDVDEDWLDPPLEWITNSPYLGRAG